MPIKKGAEFTQRDIFIDYPFEEVMFRWDHQRELVFRKFYGKQEALESVPHSNRLFNDALLYGEEISEEQYKTGRNA